MSGARIVFVTAILTHYRQPFHERVRALLAEAGCRYDLVYGQPIGSDAARRDTVDLPWATRIANRGIGPLLWQPIRDAIRGADLVVIGQENRLLANYLLQLMPGRRRPMLALWGHGRNFQARDPHSLAERWKRLWARRPDWWFAYTDETRRHIESLGFPANRITVFNNSVDTRALRAQADAVRPDRIMQRRRELGLAGDNVAIFVGGLHDDKRIGFLVAAADAIRAEIADFELIVAGAGDGIGELATLAVARPWLKPVGPRFGDDKMELMRCAKLFLMPGLVGLAILDAAAAGLPTVTTAFPHHSPEIVYLDDGADGLIVADWGSSPAYADAVIGLLRDPARLAAMGAAARRRVEALTIEAMAARFTAGALAALAAGPVRRR